MSTLIGQYDLLSSTLAEDQIHSFPAHPDAESSIQHEESSGPTPIIHLEATEHHFENSERAVCYA